MKLRKENVLNTPRLHIIAIKTFYFLLFSMYNIDVNDLRYQNAVDISWKDMCYVMIRFIGELDQELYHTVIDFKHFFSIFGGKYRCELKINIKT